MSNVEPASNWHWVGYSITPQPASLQRLVTTFMFWNFSPGQSESDWAVEAYKTLKKSTLAFVFWEFNENSFGNPQFGGSNTTWPQWPIGISATSEYHTTASLCRPYTRFVVDAQMFGLYIALQSVPLLLCWAVLFWRSWKGLLWPSPSSFPLVDFTLKFRPSGTPLVTYYRPTGGGKRLP